MEKPPRRSKGQRSSLSASINERIRDGVIEKKLKRDRKPQQKSELDRRMRSICTKLDEGNVKAGIRLAVGDKIADFTIDNYAALKLKHPQRETCSVPDPTDISGRRKKIEGTGSKIRVSPQVDIPNFLNGIETTRIEIFIT